MDLILDLTVATSLISVMLAAVVVWRRQKPYTHQDLIAAMDRICNGTQELWTVLDDADDKAGAAAGVKTDSRALRATCIRMLQDILRNTCFILDRAEPCSRADGRRELERLEINRCAAQVARRSLSLIFYVRWTRLQLAFQPDPIQICRQTLKAAAKYTCLWMAVVALLEAKFPVLKEELSHVG